MRGGVGPNMWMVIQVNPSIVPSRLYGWDQISGLILLSRYLLPTVQPHPPGLRKAKRDG